MPVGLSSSYALDGEEAHELLEYALTHQYTSAYEAKIMSGVNWTHRHDDEDSRLESVQTTLDFVQELIDAYKPHLTVYLETQFIFPTEDNDDAGGTSDVTIWVPDLDMMIVADFKHGSGVVVSATENSQLMFYAVGSRQELRRQGMCNSGKTIYRMIIMQPRGFHKDGAMREWTCNDNRLDQFVGEVNLAIRKTKEINPEIVPAGYCRFCPAVSACPEAEQHRMKSVLPTYNNMAELRKTGLPPVADLSVDRIAQILQMQGMVQEWFNAVEKQAIALARSGVAIPDHKLVYAQARSKWNGEPIPIANHLASITGLPMGTFIKDKLVTLTEAYQIGKDLIYKRVGDRKRAKPQIEAMNKSIAQLTIKDTSGNMVLVDREDKRPEVNLASLIEYKPSNSQT